MASAGQTRIEAAACAVSPIASRRSAATCLWTARSVAALGSLR